MIKPQLLLTIGGFYNLAFAIFHVFFWKIFRWREDLASLTHVNRGIVQPLNLCLTFLFLVMSYVSFVFQNELVYTDLGRTLLISFAVFWLLRTIEQVVFFGIKHKISLALIFVFLFGIAIYLLPVL